VKHWLRRLWCALTEHKLRGVRCLRCGRMQWGDLDYWTPPPEMQQPNPKEGR